MVVEDSLRGFDTRTPVMALGTRALLLRNFFFFEGRRENLVLPDERKNR